jgi:hypothetical protein
MFTAEELQALRLSLEVAGRSVLLSLPFAIAAAWLLARRRFVCRTLLDAAFHLPLVLPPVVIGYFLLLIFGGRGPVGAWLSEYFGLRLVFTTAGAALATAVMSFPLVVRAIRLSIENIDPGLRLRALARGRPVSASHFPSRLNPGRRHRGLLREPRGLVPSSRSFPTFRETCTPAAFTPQSRHLMAMRRAAHRHLVGLIGLAGLLPPRARTARPLRLCP